MRARADIERDVASVRARELELERDLTAVRGRRAEFEAELAMAEPERCRLVVVTNDRAGISHPTACFCRACATGGAA